MVEAFDGRSAAFCVAWPDPAGLTGRFEPVAVHPGRRLGLGRAVLRAGMQAMLEWGMSFTEVAYGIDNPESGPLHQSEGFEPVEQVILYRNPIGPGPGYEESVRSYTFSDV